MGASVACAIKNQLMTELMRASSKQALSSCHARIFPKRRECVVRASCIAPLRCRHFALEPIIVWGQAYVRASSMPCEPCEPHRAFTGKECAKNVCHSHKGHIILTWHAWHPLVARVMLTCTRSILLHLQSPLITRINPSQAGLGAWSCSCPHWRNDNASVTLMSHTLKILNMSKLLIANTKYP